MISPRPVRIYPAVAWYRQEKSIAVNHARMRGQRMLKLRVSATTLPPVPLREFKMPSLNWRSKVARKPAVRKDTNARRASRLITTWG